MSLTKNYQWHLLSQKIINANRRYFNNHTLIINPGFI